MRAIWKGAVSFGLVSIAVKLYSATEEKDIRFHQVHRTDGGRIKYQRTCSVDGAVVSYDDIAKGYDIGGGEMVILTDDDFADLPLSTSRAIDVLEFVPAEQIDPILFAKSYYLEPEGQAAKPYVLLRDALRDADRVAIVKIAIRQREQLASLRVRDDVLVLNTMMWPDEVRAPEFGFLDDDIETRPAELAMASSLIDSMAGTFKPEDFTDDYRAALQEVIDAKVEGREVVQPEETEEAAPAAIDLMAALKASVERARQARGEDPPSGTRDAPPPAKKASAAAPSAARKKAAPAAEATTNTTTAAKSTTAAAKKTTAKKTAAKKTTAKKTTPAAKAAKKSA
ncbi:Ku protein [Actinoplanes sp. NBRC 101535]|uniref:non-homologous end joining protein Ku n=1 Tax=Actinoplanes sp. NBRC 101535 TaxID=3032196 RepID=UPI0024A5BEF6|nr:Ku protein [Actinoplanes sp. NBRC 101535]GLY05904.1 non-homologous end joining protein Ku [Actinoplanes sp. NBRC 101535]